VNVFLVPAHPVILDRGPLNGLFVRLHCSTADVDVAHCYRWSRRSVGQSACLSRLRALQKSLNQSRCHLGCWVRWVQESMH